MKNTWIVQQGGLSEVKSSQIWTKAGSMLPMLDKNPNIYVFRLLFGVFVYKSHDGEWVTQPNAAGACKRWKKRFLLVEIRLQWHNDHLLLFSDRNKANSDLTLSLSAALLSFIWLLFQLVIHLLLLPWQIRNKQIWNCSVCRRRFIRKLICFFCLEISETRSCMSCFRNN